VGVDTPVLNVSVGHVDFWETGPFGPGHWVIQPDIVCGPCGFDKICPHHACKDQIIVQEVAQLCLHILGKGPFPSFSQSIRVYEGRVTQHQLGTFRLRAGHEDVLTSWYGDYWRTYWYAANTSQMGRTGELSDLPPDYSEIPSLWETLAPQLDQLCAQARSFLECCQKKPVPLSELKSLQQELKVGTLAMKELTRPSLAFGPLAVAFVRDTFNLEAPTLADMAKEQACAYSLFRMRAEEMMQRLSECYSQTSRRMLYASTIG